MIRFTCSMPHSFFFTLSRNFIKQFSVSAKHINLVTVCHLALISSIIRFKKKVRKNNLQMKARNPRVWVSEQAIDSNNWFTTMTGQLRWRNSDFEEQSRKKNINNSFVFMRAEYILTQFFFIIFASDFFFLLLRLFFALFQNITLNFVLHLMLCTIYVHTCCVLFLILYFLALIMMFV